MSASLSYVSVEPSPFDEWAERNAHWLELARPKERRSKRAKVKAPLILCGNGVSLSIDRGSLLIRDGLTHYPQERTVYRFFKGDPALPPRIIMLDGNGSLSFDVVSWLAEQRVPLIRIDWRGEVASVIGGQGFGQVREKVRWQIETREDPERRLKFARQLIVEKLRSSLKTLQDHIPSSSARTVAIARCEAGIHRLEHTEIETLEEVRGIEAGAAASYFATWKGLGLNWREEWKRPIPDAWRTFDGHRFTDKGLFITKRNATHPFNAMLNYTYGVLRSHVQIEIAAQGYDPCRGIMHHDREDTQAFVYDLIEPRRAVADAALLEFVRNKSFSGMDFILNSDGVCRVAPQLARQVARLGAV